MRFNEGPDGVELAVGGQDKIVRLLNLNRLKTLFSNAAQLENEAEQQGGFMIGDGPDGEPEIIPLPQDRFNELRHEPDLKAASR
jgi:hypothetical protein